MTDREWPCPRCGATGTQPHRPGCPYGLGLLGKARITFPQLIWNFQVIAYWRRRLHDQRRGW